MSLTPPVQWGDGDALRLGGDVVPLRPADPAPVEDVVRKLRDILARAERGEVIGIAVACSMNDRRTASVYEVGEGDVSHLVTAMERLKLRLLQAGED